MEQLGVLLEKYEKRKNGRKQEQRKSASSDIFQACSNIIYCFLKGPSSELSAKDIQNKISENGKEDEYNSQTEISSNVFRKALLYLCDDVHFLDKSNTYGKYILSDSITIFNADEILNKLKIDKNKLDDAIKLINGDNELKLIIPKGDTDISLKSKKLCSLFRGNDASIISDVFESAFTDFSISNFKGLIRDTFLGAKLYKCFNSNDQLMPVLLQIIKYDIKIDISVKINHSILQLENININKVEITDDNIFLKSDILNLKLNDISDIQNIKIVTLSANKNRYGLPIIYQKTLLEALKKNDNFPQIEKSFDEFKNDIESDVTDTFEECFIKLIKSRESHNKEQDESTKRPRTFIEMATRYLKSSKLKE